MMLIVRRAADRMKGVAAAMHAAGIGRMLGLLSVLLSGTLLSSFLSFLAQVLLARHLPIDDFGRMAALLAAVNFFTPLGSAGLGAFLLRVFAQEGAAARSWAAASSRLMTLASVTSALGVAAYAMFSFGGSPPQRLAVAAACVAMVLGQVGVELSSWRFQLEDRYGMLAAWQASTQAGRLVVLLVIVVAAAVLQASAAIGQVLTGYAVVGALTAAGSVLMLRSLWSESRTGPSGALSAHAGPPSLGRAVFEAAPYGLVTMCYVLLNQGIVVIVEWLRGGAVAGLYNAAFLVTSAAFLLPAIVYMKFLTARICRWAVHDRPRFQALFHIGAAAMLVLGVAIMLVMVAGAPWIIRLLFGSRFDASVPVLMILAVAIPLRFVQHAYSSLFVSREDTGRRARYLGSAAAAGAATSAILVPSLGATGGAIGTVIAEAVLLLLQVRGTTRFIEGIAVRDTFRWRTLQASWHRLTQPGAAAV